MATLSTGMTLAELAKRQDPDGSIATIVEALSKQNDILQDITFMSGNLETGHRTTIRRGWPTVTARMLNEYVTPGNSNTAQVTFEAAEFTSWIQMDQGLLDLAADSNALIATEVQAHMEAVMQEVATTLFYGDHTTNPREFTGLAHYYNSTTAESADNLILGGGSGSDNASIYFIGWGERKISGFVPKNTTAGLSVIPYGEETAQNSAGGVMRVNRTKITQLAGLAVEDWRYGARACNIDRSGIASVDLPAIMFSLAEKMPTQSGYNGAYYMDSTVLEALRKQLSTKIASSTLTIENVGGVRTTMFNGFPIRICNALLVDEALVS